MDEQRYDIVFNGVTLPGIDRSTVMHNLVQVFRTTQQTVERLLDGGTHVLKRDVDAATAQKYRAALERAGAHVNVVPTGSPTEEAPATSDTTPQYGFVLAPVGADLLAPHERRRVEAVVTPDISALSLAEPGADLGVRSAATAPAPPDVSALTLAEPGIRLSPESAPAPPAPDTAHLSLAPPGTPLGTTSAAGPEPS